MNLILRLRRVDLAFVDLCLVVVGALVVMLLVVPETPSPVPAKAAQLGPVATPILANLPDDDSKNVLPAAEARDHLDETRTFEMVVRSSRDVQNSMVYFLNSETNYRDEKCLTIVIEYRDAEAFRKAGIDNPADHFREKTIRVTGKVVKRSNQNRLVVTKPDQIEVVKKADSP